MPPSAPLAAITAGTSAMARPSKVRSRSRSTNSTAGGYGEWDNVNIATNVGDIEIANGALGMKGLGGSVGDPTKTITVDAGNQLIFWNSSFGPNSGYNKNIHVLGGAIFAVRTSPNTFFNGNVTLEDNAEWDYFNGGGNQTMNGTYTLNGNVHMLIGDSTVTFANVISGTGGFIWDAYNNQVVFTAANTYSGGTVIGGGLGLALTGTGSISHSTPIFFGGNNPANVSLDVTGRPDQTLTLLSGQTLGGIGSIKGSLVVSAGATIAPSGTNITLGRTTGNSSTGTLTASNGVTLAGTTIIKLNGSGVSDQVQSGAAITYGGTLNLVNISGSPLAAGNSFQIFNATTFNPSSFSSIVPASPGAGLAWDTSHLNTGSLNVIAGSAPPSVSNVSIVGGNLVFSGSGGTASGSYVVQVNTNLATTNWTAIATNSFDSSGGFNATNVISGGTPKSFYRIKVLP